MYTFHLVCKSVSTWAHIATKCFNVVKDDLVWWGSTCASSTWVAFLLIWTSFHVLFPLWIGLHSICACISKSTPYFSGCGYSCVCLFFCSRNGMSTCTYATRAFHSLHESPAKSTACYEDQQQVCTSTWSIGLGLEAGQTNSVTSCLQGS